MTSANQDAWQEIADAVRSQIAKQVPLMPAMKPEEQKDFMDVIQRALWLTHSADTYDAQVMKEENLWSAD